MLFDQHQNFVNFATTRGIYYTWVHGEVFSQRLHDMPTDMLFTSVGGTRYDDWTKATYAAPFSDNERSPVYFTKDRSRNWGSLSGNAQIQNNGGALSLNAGVSCILADKEDGNTLYLCNRDGVFKTTDLGKTYRRVYSSSTNSEK
jgi:hypothetical protein